MRCHMEKERDCLSVFSFGALYVDKGSFKTETFLNIGILVILSRWMEMIETESIT